MADEPDGTPAAPDVLEPAPLRTLPNETFYELLNIEDNATFIERVNSLEQDQINDFADRLNPTIFALTAPDEVLVELINRIDAEALDAFFADMLPDSIGIREMANEDNDGVSLALVALDDLPLHYWLENIGPDSGRIIAARLNDDAQEALEARLVGIGKTTDDYVWMDVLGRGVADEPDPEEPEDDLDEDDKQGGGCFIATVAYADPMHEDVVYLRAYRERALRPILLGRGIIALYAVLGPCFASILTPLPTARMMVRRRLSQLVVHLQARENMAIVRAKAAAIAGNNRVLRNQACAPPRKKTK